MVEKKKSYEELIEAYENVRSAAASMTDMRAKSDHIAGFLNTLTHKELNLLVEYINNRKEGE